MIDDTGSDLFSEVNLIPLKENDDFLIGRADKLIKCDSFFYVLDKNKTNAIYKYDYKGNPVKRFCKIGGSGDEYVEIVDFDIDQSSKEIVIFCVPPKILYTDTDFNNLGKNNYLGNSYFNNIVSWNNEIFLSSDWDRMVARINPETGKPEECFRTRLMRGIMNSSGAPPVFFKTPNNLYFHSEGGDSIYKLQDNKFIPYITLDYKEKESCMKLYAEKRVQDITVNERIEHPLPSVNSIREKDDKLIISYEHYHVFRICTYDIVKNKYKDQYKTYITEDNGGYFDNALYGIVTPADHNGMKIFKMSGYQEFMKGVKCDFTGKLEYDDDFGNPVIVEQILK
jgi:hypothetical protein